MTGALKNVLKIDGGESWRVHIKGKGIILLGAHIKGKRMEIVDNRTCKICAVNCLIICAYTPCWTNCIVPVLVRL